MARKRAPRIELTIPTFQLILDQETRAEALIQLLTQRTIKGLQLAVKEFSVRAQLVLRELLDGKGDEAAGQDAVDYGMLIADALLDAGLNDVAKEYRAQFKEVEKAALEYFEVFEPRMVKPGFDVTDIRALATVQKQAFLDLADKRLVEPMREAVLNGILGNRSSDEIITQVQQVMTERGILTRDRVPFTNTQLETLVEDSYRRYYRVTKMTQAVEVGLEVIWWQGPDDKLTSPQCRHLLRAGRHGPPNMWLRSEFTTKLHPGLKQDPLVAGGHWNCRHTVNPITMGFAESMGFKPPKSAEVPSDAEVAKKVARL